MKQHRLGLSATGKKTRRRELLESLEQVAPWSELVALVQPFRAETILRIHFMQQRFNLSDPALEEALHDVPL